MRYLVLPKRPEGTENYTEEQLAALVTRDTMIGVVQASVHPRARRMTQTENLVKRIPNDIGGLPAEPIERVDHELEPWEKRCHALADVLDFHKIINTEEKRLTGRCLRLNPKAAANIAGAYRNAPFRMSGLLNEHMRSFQR